MKWFQSLRGPQREYGRRSRLGINRAEVSKLISQAEDAKVRFVNLQFTDLMGIVKSVTIPMHQLEDACINGKWFDGSSIEGFARIAESDMFLVPDLIA